MLLIIGSTSPPAPDCAIDIHTPPSIASCDHKGIEFVIVWDVCYGFLIYRQ